MRPHRQAPDERMPDSRARERPEASSAATRIAFGTAANAVSSEGSMDAFGSRK
jgi:hypothetical protein